ncbi:hypothetical protein KIPB_009682, partial [Kipferlia bialata]
VRDRLSPPAVVGLLRIASVSLRTAKGLAAWGEDRGALARLVDVIQSSVQTQQEVEAGVITPLTQSEYDAYSGKCTGEGQHVKDVMARARDVHVEHSLLPPSASPCSPSAVMALHVVAQLVADGRVASEVLVQPTTLETLLGAIQTADPRFTDKDAKIGPRGSKYPDARAVVQLVRDRRSDAVVATLGIVRGLLSSRDTSTRPLSPLSGHLIDLLDHPSLDVCLHATSAIRAMTNHQDTSGAMVSDVLRKDGVSRLGAQLNSSRPELVKSAKSALRSLSAASPDVHVILRDRGILSLVSSSASAAVSSSFGEAAPTASPYTSPKSPRLRTPGYGLRMADLGDLVDSPIRQQRSPVPPPVPATGGRHQSDRTRSSFLNLAFGFSKKK